MDKCYSNFPEGYFSKEPHPQYIVVQPPKPQLPDQKLIGYMVYGPPDTLCVPPCRRSMNFFGTLSSILFLFFFWPLTCVPCFCGGSYDGFQYPVYE